LYFDTPQNMRRITQNLLRVWPMARKISRIVDHFVPS
jgi:hypothetical protein